MLCSFVYEFIVKFVVYFQETTAIQQFKKQYSESHFDEIHRVIMAETGDVILKEIKNGLQTAQSKNDILRWLSVTRAVLNPHDLHVDPDKLLEFGYGLSVIQSVKKSDLQAHLKRILEILISKFSVEWMSTLTTENFNTCVKPLFFEGPKRETFLVLLKAVTEPKR